MPPRDLRAYLFDIAEACRRIEDFTRGAAHGSELPFGGPFVPIDRGGGRGYRVSIYSPSDQPVSASAGVFSCERR